MENKIVDKIKDLKKGDTVVVYNDLDTRTTPFESAIKSIGKKWITDIHSNKFDCMGYGDYGWGFHKTYYMKKMEQFIDTVKRKFKK